MDVYYGRRRDGRLGSLGRTRRNQTGATELPVDFGSGRLLAPVNGGDARSKVPWVIDTVVPRGFLATSTRASSCLASASTMIVPNPGVVLSKFSWPSRVPIPLSETANLQFVSAAS